MKKIYIIIVFLVMFVLFPLCASAQSITDDNETAGDSLKTGGQAVNVAFRTVDRENLLGGVSVLDITDMMTKAYSLNPLYYLYSAAGGLGNNAVWGLGDLGDQTNNNNRGCLFVVDGIVRDANNVLPSEVAQVTMLKSAAAVALYGSRGAKGVILITTKRGKEGKLHFSVRANTGINVPKAFPQYLGSAEYMTLYNEAQANDGVKQSYTPEDIYNYGSGLNPYRYPNLNFYSSDYLKKMYTRSEAMAEITGGNDRAHYYVTAGYYRVNGLLNVGNAKDDNTSRMFARGNIDIKLHELITATVDANATFYDARTANTNFWSAAATFRPNRVAPLIPLSYIEDNDRPSKDLLSSSINIIDGKYFLGGTQLDQTNPIADAYAAGDGKYVSRQFQFNSGVNFNLKNVTDGLFFRFKYGIDYHMVYTQSYSNTYATYSPVWNNYSGTDLISSLTKYGNDQKTGNQNINGSAYWTTNFFSGQFDYTKSFNDGDHNVFAMLLANGWQRQLSSYIHRMTNVNLGLQLSYNFRQKYYLDFTSALPYSAKLPEGNRAGFSPTATLGWRLTKESFMSNQSVFDDLMATVSGGIIKTDLPIYSSDDTQTPMGYYLYKPILTTGAWWSWADNSGEAATQYNRGSNPNLTFVKRKEFSAGLRGSMFDKFITFDANYFITRIDGDIARVSSKFPIYFTQYGYPTSSIVPYVNYNISQYQGIDYSVYFNKKLNAVDLTVGVSGMYQTDKWVRIDQTIAYDYQTNIGRPLYSIWGLQNQGFFMDQASIASSPQQAWGALHPGDIKYKDQNNDKKIDSNDAVYLGRGGAPMTLGLNLTVKWKRFTLFSQGTGYYGGHGLKSNSYWWSGCSDNKYSEVVRGRWTEATKNTATYPRLSTSSGDNNFRSSDFWLYSTDRFDIQMVQLTWDFPKKMLSNLGVSDLSIYVDAYDLPTLSKERKLMEMNIGSAPQTRFYNLGLKVTF